ILRVFRHRDLAVSVSTVIAWLSIYLFERSWAKTIGLTGTLLIYAGGLSLLLDRLWYEKSQHLYAMDSLEASEPSQTPFQLCHDSKSTRCESCTSRRILRRHSGTGGLPEASLACVARSATPAWTSRSSPPLRTAPSRSRRRPAARPTMVCRFVTFRWPGRSGTGAGAGFCRPRWT